MLINLSNHPSDVWSTEQLQAAAQYGKLRDMAFPAIDPRGDENYLEQLAEQYLHKILSLNKENQSDITVHIMGEMTFTFALVRKLQKTGVLCIASTSERNTIDLGNGQKKTSFKFVRFRRYQLLEME